MPFVLEKENVLVYEDYRKYFFPEPNVPENSPYPSVFNMPKPTFVSRRSLRSIIRRGEVDALLVSSRVGEPGLKAIREAKSRDIPVAIIDVWDIDNFDPAVIENDLFNGFTPGKDFDLYFKADLLLGYQTETVLPLRPLPVRPETCVFVSYSKDIDLFYSGRFRKKAQPERAETVKVLQENFHNSLILTHTVQSTFPPLRKYREYFSRCKIVHSPSGRTWDSFKYCEAGMVDGTAVLAPKPWLETVEPHFKDGENAILYDVVHRDGRYHLKSSAEFIDKIRHYLENADEREAISSRWKRDVFTGHTVLARSKYILACMEKMF